MSDRYEYADARTPQQVDADHAAVLREMFPLSDFVRYSKVRAAIERSIELLEREATPPLRSIDNLLTPEQRQTLNDDLAKIAKQRRKGEAEARNVVLP